MKFYHLIRTSFSNRHVILNGAKRSTHTGINEESLKMWPTQAVFGADKLTFRSKLQGFFASLRMTWWQKVFKKHVLSLSLLFLLTSCQSALIANCPPSCAGMNLQDKNLMGYNFAAAEMSRVNLTNSNLKLADFNQAQLAGANLSQTQLSHANFEGVNLRGATMTKANLVLARLKGADLTGSDLTAANLTQVDLRHVILQGINFHTAILIAVNLEQADLNASNLSEAQLMGANLKQAQLVRVSLAEADLRGADLSGANLVGTLLVGADLSGANLTGVDLSGADLRGANLTGANLHAANLEGANLDFLDDISDGLIPTNLSGADLSLAKLNQANLHGAILTGADLAESTLVETNLTESNVNGANFRRTDLRWVNFLNVQMLDGIKYRFQKHNHLMVVYAETLTDIQMLDLSIAELIKRLALRKIQQTLLQPVICANNQACVPTSYSLSQHTFTTNELTEAEQLFVSSFNLAAKRDWVTPDGDLTNALRQLTVAEFLQQANTHVNVFITTLKLSSKQVYDSGIKQDDMTLWPDWLSFGKAK